MLGTVISRTTTQVKVSFQEPFGLDDGPWRFVRANLVSLYHLTIGPDRLDVGISDISFNRMRTAISHLHLDPLQQECAPNASDRQIILQGTYLRDVLLRSFSKTTTSLPAPLQLPDEVDYPHEALDHGSRMIGDNSGAFRDDMRIMSWAKRYREIEPVRIEGDPDLIGLNPTQIRAIAMVIGERTSLVQGVNLSRLIVLPLCDTPQPPGTGKTKTIVEAVRLLKARTMSQSTVLVC